MRTLPRARRIITAALVLVAGSAPWAAPPAASKFPLTIDSIMRGPELVGYPPSDLRWSGDAKTLFFEWRRPGEDDAATWRVDRAGGQPTRLSPEERLTAPLPNGSWDATRQTILGVDRGDVVAIDTIARRRRTITRTTAAEANPRWARNGTAVTFVRENNLYVVNHGPDQAGELVQLTDVVSRRPPSTETASQRYVKKEERELLEWAAEAAARRERREKTDRARAIPRFELGERQYVADAALVGDTHAYLIVGQRAQARVAQVPRFVSESGYTEPIDARVNVGDAQERRRLVILNLTTGDAVWAGLDEVVDPLVVPAPPLPSEGAAEDKPAPRPDPFAATRGARWGSLVVSPDGGRAVASVRADDNTDRWLVVTDATTGKSTVVDHQHDDAWVRSIEPSNNYTGGLGWLPDSRRVWFLAERDGWMHLYTVDVTAAAPTAVQLTSGRFEIDQAQLSPDGRTFYVQSTEEHPGERHIYGLGVDGGTRTKLTTTAGSWNGEIAPDGRAFGVVFSTANRPPEVFVMATGGGAPPVQVTTSTSEEWRSYPWVEPQLVTYRTRDGVDVQARLYTPEMVGAKRSPTGAAVIFVHGSGYLQNAHRYWSTYYREYMFHHLLASRGYVVLDPDYRASAGYGRDWRTAIYRWMGGKDLEDVLDGAAYLAKSHKVNPKRIGVYGGSYGGFITLMAMFTSPDTFAAGAALRPVTDWAHYNHGYTANILNEPQSDPEAYRKSSPIYFAERLKGALLICHGMVDTNVHFQDSVRLAQRLIELRKENWELAVYPVEDHGFVEATSWADEYKRILKLFDAHLTGPAASRGSAGTQ